LGGSSGEEKGKGVAETRDKLNASLKKSPEGQRGTGGRGGGGAVGKGRERVGEKGSQGTWKRGRIGGAQMRKKKIRRGKGGGGVKGKKKEKSSP